MISSILITLILLILLEIFGFLNAIPLVNNDTEALVVEAKNFSDERISQADDNSIDLSHFDSSLFGNPDEKNTAIEIENYSRNMNVNPEELGSYVEGDMLIPKNRLRNGIIAESYRWPNGIVPYEIRGAFTAYERTVLENAFYEYQSRTCIKFVPHTYQEDYISIVSGRSGCWSSVGRIGGKQEVNLQSPGCLSQKGTVIHELMHVLGFLHEQNRYERDSFIQIQYENIQNNVYSNFAKASPTTANGFGVPYDYSSVMHYSAYAFSKNNLPTIIALRNTGERLGQREGFSPKDLQKINAMYKCYHVTTTGGQHSIASSFLQGFLSGLRQ